MIPGAHTTDVPVVLSYGEMNRPRYFKITITDQQLMDFRQHKIYSGFVFDIVKQELCRQLKRDPKKYDLALVEEVSDDIEWSDPFDLAKGQYLLH